MLNKNALIIFAKAPVPGKVKSRLIPAIGKHKATSLYKQLLSKTIDTAMQSGFSSIQLWINGNLKHPDIFEFKHRYGLKLYSQHGPTLGARMCNAFDTVLRNHSYAVLIGSDCPSLIVSDIQQAAAYLENNMDVVLGPAEDGGYYLIGLRKNNFQLFNNIKWGTASVAKETCARIDSLNWKSGFLPKRKDLDRTLDLLHYLKLKR